MKKYPKYKPSGVEWIIDIPENWNIKKLKFIAQICNGQDQKAVLDDNGIYPVYGSGGVFGMANSFLYDKPSILLGRKGTIDKPQYVDKPFWSVDTSYYTKIRDGYYIRYFYYLCTTINFDLYKYGSAIPSMTQGHLNEIKFALPKTLEEQTQIANYLDYKTNEIETLIANKQKLIELLQEERTATINHAITKGVPSSLSVRAESRTKPSGIEWLGDIPEHWEVKKIGHLSKVVRGASPRPAGDPLLFNGEFLPWITVKEVTNAIGKFITSTETYLTELGSEQTRILEPETLILSNSGATLGVPKITLIRGGINDGSVAFFNLIIEREFLYYFFVTHTKIYRDEASGYGQPNLNTEIVKSTKMAIPPIEEQKLIIQLIEKEQERISTIITKTEQEIELLKEYKTALISEVVTGKVDVREEKF